MDIYAYHHTTKENSDSIFKNGFKEKYIKKVSIGFGVQCFLTVSNNSKYEGKADGQIKVIFKNCRLLEDSEEIRRSTDRIQKADAVSTFAIAREEAERIKSLGYNAYKYNKDIIVFLNFPTPIEWIPFEEPICGDKTLKDAIIELANEIQE